MNVLLGLFLALAAVLWLSVFGYLIGLGSLARGRKRPSSNGSSWPAIAVVVPTLNEEEMIGQKLRDLRRIDYLREKVSIVVVDGGSTDKTKAIVKQQIELGEDVRLVALNGAPGKASQINHALRLIDEEFVVVTDVDSLLEPSCVKELVVTLLSDPKTAVVGAAVRPESALLEERIHWWFLNYLWWLEGEVLSSAGVSGVAYACRRSLAVHLPEDAKAEDIHLALAASAQGWRVRLCRTARATELRVPQKRSDLLHFRRRRGRWYIAELLRAHRHFQNPPLGWRLVRSMRRWHFFVTPKIGLATALLAGVLLWTHHWPWLLAAFGAFWAPVLAALGASSTLASDGARWWRLALASLRLCALTTFSMLTLNGYVPLKQTVRGRR